MSEEAQIEQVTIDDNAGISVEVVTAKKFPRNPVLAARTVVEMIKSSDTFFEKVQYAIPRRATEKDHRGNEVVVNKIIQGPTVYLAKAIASEWTNLRCDSYIDQVGDSHVSCVGVCWDLEKNLGYKVCVVKSITTKQGFRYSNDMITLTQMSGMAVALRNAILSVVPTHVVDDCILAANEKAREVLDKSPSARHAKYTQAWKKCVDRYKLTDQEIATALGMTEGCTIDFMNNEHYFMLVRFSLAIESGDSTVESIFKPAPARSQQKAKSSLNFTESEE
jgi:hypothetical protein